MTVLAVVEPNTLQGTELRQQLRLHRELWGEVRLLSGAADDEIATLSELDGAASLVRPLTTEQLAGVDLVFVCGDTGEPSAAPWELADPEATTVLLYPASIPAGAVPVVSGVNLQDARAGRVLVSPHPAVILLAILLYPLLPFDLRQVAAWLVQPATLHGRRGMDELMDQTRALLAFSDDRPTEVFGQQLAFNLLPTTNPTEQLTAEVATLLGGAVTPAIELVQGAVFHSFTASVLVELGEASDPEEVAEALDGHPLIEAWESPDEPAPSPIAAAGGGRLLRGAVTAAPGAPGRYWLRTVMDNLTRGGAINALEIAAAVLA